MTFILNLLICYTLVASYQISLFLRVSSPAALPFQRSSISFEVRCYRSQAVPVSKPLHKKNRYFFRGKRGLQMNGTTGLLPFRCSTGNKPAACSSNSKRIKKSHEK